MSTLGERIKSLRGALSREKFGNKYGIHRNTLERWEKGLRMPPESFLMAIAAGEHVSLQWVKTGADENALHTLQGRETSVDPNNIHSGKQSPLNNFEQPPTVGGQSKASPLQHTVNTKDYKNGTSDVGSNVMLIQALQEKATLLSQLGDLRVEVERLRMELERRDRRIEELKKAYNEEHEELMLLKKTLSPTSPQPVQPVTEKELQH